jgi:integrase
VQRSTRQGNPRVARQIEAAYRTKLAKGEVDIHDPKPIPAFTKAMRDFLEWSAQEHKAHPRTYRRYVTSSVAPLNHFKGVSLDRITPEDVERFKTERSKQKGPRTKRQMPPATVNRELACLKALFNFVIKGDLILKNPVCRVKFLAEDNEQMRVLTFNEQRTHLSAASQPLRDIATLMLETGMRPEEVYRIHRENTHLEEGYLYNPYGKTKAAKRKIPLSISASEVIRRRLVSTKGGYLFPHRKDGDRPMIKANNAHDVTLRKTGIHRFRMYDRHTWATRAAMSGVDLVLVFAITMMFARGLIR